uniref:Uncharacterized protein n=1 Tax=Molossus molossus TaxID=27622 RepID=A0A7J8JX67_MOLMO|nr:hypothetical protein HJG59_007773 [Molossus molossus]
MSGINLTLQTSDCGEDQVPLRPAGGLVQLLAFRVDGLPPSQQQHTEREEGRERNIDEREHWPPSAGPPLGIGPTSWACALTGNRTSDVFVWGPRSATEPPQLSKTLTFEGTTFPRRRGAPGRQGHMGGTSLCQEADTGAKRAWPSVSMGPSQRERGRELGWGRVNAFSSLGCGEGSP